MNTHFDRILDPLLIGAIAFVFNVAAVASLVHQDAPAADSPMQASSAASAHAA